MGQGNQQSTHTIEPQVHAYYLTLGHILVSLIYGQMNMNTPHPSRNQGKILKFHRIERVKAEHELPLSL